MVYSEQKNDLGFYTFSKYQQSIKDLFPNRNIVFINVNKKKNIIYCIIKTCVYNFGDSEKINNLLRIENISFSRHIKEL